ncbi:MAG: transposase [Daejeonella sp.]
MKNNLQNLISDKPRDNRKSIRLKGYDYSQAGAYCKNRECLFGEITNDKMILNDVGKIADECWLAIPQHFPNAVLHQYIIMPNHVHGIIQLIGDVVVAVENFQPLQQQTEPKRNEFQKIIPRSIGSIIRGYKIGVTKFCRNEQPQNFPSRQPVWQRNYYEHIIRNEQSYHTISDYIINNPLKWNKDKFFR